MITSITIETVLLLQFALLALCSAHPVYHDAIDVSAHQRALKCTDTCRLFLCNNLQDPTRTSLRLNGAPNLFRGNGLILGGAFCNRNEKQLVDVRIGQALVSPAGSSTPKVPISEYSPPGLSQPFPKGYIRVIEGGNEEVRLTRGRSTGNQNEFASDLCVRVPVESYRKLNRDGSKGPLVTSTNQKDCVLFESRVSKLEFLVQWNTSDDMDIFLREPSGCVLSRFSQSCPSGARLKRDNGFGGRCRTLPVSGINVAREQVNYALDSAVQNGTYALRIQHTHNCGFGPTSYTVSVAANGNVVKRRTGVSNNFGSGFVATFNLNVRL